MDIAVVVIVVVLGVGGYAIAGMVAEQRRREAMRNAASSLGLQFEGTWPQLRLAELGALPLFCVGDVRRVENAMTGSVRGVELLLFDYRYTVIVDRRRRNTYVQTVCWLRIAGARLPGFALRPEGVFDKIGAAFGMQDIDFPEHPAFSRRYVLRGEQEPAIRRLFLPNVLAHFESHEASVEAAVDRLAVYEARTRVAPAELPALIDRALAIRELLAPSSCHRA